MDAASTDAMVADMTGFDEFVRQQRKKMEQAMQGFGLKSAVSELKAAADAGKESKKQSKKRRTPCEDEEEQEPVEPRRSKRHRPEVNYAEDGQGLAVTLGSSKHGRASQFHQTSPEEEEAMRVLLDARRKAQADGAGNGSRGPRDSGKGVRVQGGKLYDSVNGVTCHWCRQKTLDGKVSCTKADCSISFCRRCLLNRNGEDIKAAVDSGAWVCPCCRGGCGQGCVTCCNCGPCRKKLKMGPTGQIKKLVIMAGYTNAHDFLVGTAKGLDQKQMTERKLAKDWATWMRPNGGTQPEQPQEEEEDKEAAPAPTRQSRKRTAAAAADADATTTKAQPPVKKAHGHKAAAVPMQEEEQVEVVVEKEVPKNVTQARSRAAAAGKAQPVKAGEQKGQRQQEQQPQMRS